MFVDSHAHLDGSEFDADREAVIERARVVGLRYLLAIGGATGPEEMEASLHIATGRDWIYAAAGIHPHEASKAQDAHFDLLRRLTCEPKFLAVGEIGLDYYYDHSPREVQIDVFIRQLDLAREVRLPIIIHCRDAWADLREIIRAHWRDTGLGGILHCFSGTRADAFQFMDWGFLVSFAGNLSFKKAEDLRTVACEVPLERLLTETDCPYLAPVPHRGRRNEPAYVVEVARELARLRGLAGEEMGERTLRNFAEFFRLAC